ncbi:cupin domain-containing protein [Rutstroemia sp. NJR-2017a WRK4]|nr:cupin domain-containing protein [Rutstroemia sp. NJR-2017a BBW]PQE31293.1 cupin domain-containing protein [Rutstroemia sp. NJR-2017a WRK4]
MPRIPLTPPSTLKVSRHQIPRHKFIPNTSIQGHPLTIYHSCIPNSTSPSDIESHLETIGVVAPSWRYTMFDRNHFHSTTHEVLCVFSGKATLCFGGETNPGRVETAVEEGDVIIIPAGVSHRLLKTLSGDFQMIGSYPNGRHWDMCHGFEEEGKRVKNISGLGWFDQDPLYGHDGPASDE